MKIEKRWENNRSKMISYIVFGAYLFLLTWLVLFKFAFTIEEIPHLRQLNLIPFHYETSVAYITHMKEVIYNILIFVPAGVYFTAFLGKIFPKKRMSMINGIGAVVEVVGIALLSMLFVTNK